jgi:hypothetical protein
MAVIGDMRKKPLRGKTYYYCEIDDSDRFPPLTVIYLHAEKPKNTRHRVVKLHRNTVKILKRMNAWKQGLTAVKLYRRKNYS